MYIYIYREREIEREREITPRRRTRFRGAAPVVLARGQPPRPRHPLRYGQLSTRLGETQPFDHCCLFISLYLYLSLSLYIYIYTYR